MKLDYDDDDDDDEDDDDDDGEWLIETGIFRSLSWGKLMCSELIFLLACILKRWV